MQEVRLIYSVTSPAIVFIGWTFEKGFCAREARIGNSL